MSVQLPSPRSPISSDILRGHSGFSRALRELFSAIRPKRIIETGTSVGLGTTRVIASALRESSPATARFISLEVNPNFCSAARLNAFSAGSSTQVVNALSVPRVMLPTLERIDQDLQAARRSSRIAFEADDLVSAECYFAETNFPEVEDDGLGFALNEFDYRPDFVLLDSSAHVACNEFVYLISLLNGPCHIALPDIFHLKHARSFDVVCQDPRFRIFSISRERLGYCIVSFDPVRVFQGA